MANRSNEQDAPIASLSIDVLAAQFLSKVFRRKEEQRSRPKRTDLPWDSWELNREFFKTLSQWTLDNPLTTLDRVLDNISNGLEDSKDLLSLIPESPFPARGLVTALGYVFKLGVTISRAKRDVHEFAKDVIRWVGRVKSAFESPENGRFTWLAWRDLKDMRNLINEICIWAVERLRDGRWSRIGHGLMIQGEIKEFNARITDARVLFQDLSAINLAKGLDTVLQHLRSMFHRQQVIIAEIKKIRTTQERQLGQIIDELKNQKLTAERDQFLAEALAGHTVADPTYDKQGKRPCDPDTRVEVLAKIDQWINNVLPGSSNFMWLTGDPGCGKSAITASVSKECKKQNVLWAQFFINRNNAETTNPNSYFPSIASQLARHSPNVAEALQHVLLKDCTLTDSISADQAAKLFIDSIRCASHLDPRKPVVVVIDGLDETDRKRLKDTAAIFSTLFAALEAYSNVKVLISSRTENDIRNSFSLPLHDKQVKHVHLDTADPSSIRDVSHYIKRNLLDLVSEHDLNWAIWPGDERSRALGERASGLFIWGVTAMKFIQDRLDFDGTECLNEVLDTLTADVLHDVNALYMLILRVTYGTQASDWDLEKFRRIIGAILFLQEPLSIDDLAILLNIRKTSSSDPVDILHFVRRFRTILVTGADTVDGTTVPRIHKSVFEFMTSDSVDVQFRVEPEHAHLELGMQCLAQLGLAHASVTQDVLPMPFRYAFRFWSSHLSQAKIMGASILYADCRDLPSSFRHSPPLIPAVSAEPPVQIRYSSAQSQIQTLVGDYSTPWDASSGINLSNHAEYVTCLAFSPDGGRVISGSSDKTIRVWDSRDGRWICTLVEYSSPIYAISFSPNGKCVVSGSEDGLLCLWDFFTGAPIGQPFYGHKGPVNCVAFSPDGEQIVSGSRDELCILWNTQHQQPVKRPWTGHQRRVTSVAFSTNGRRFCSGDGSGHCILWDITTGQKITSWEYSGTPKTISFWPDNDDIILILGGYEIGIQSSEHQWSIPGSADTYCVLFLPDGKQVIFATPYAISVAEFDSDKKAVHVTKRRNYKSASGTKSFAFSPNLRYYACADKAVHIYALDYNKMSLNKVPINKSLPTTQPKDVDDDELKQAPSNVRAVQLEDTTLFNNRRLAAIKLYESTEKDDAASKMWVVTDDALIVACKPKSSVSAWKYRDSSQK